MNDNEGLIEVQLFSSVDQRTDSKMLPQGRLAEVENALFDKEGQTTKMRDANGYASTHSKGENIQNLDGVFVHKGRTILEGSFQDDDGGATAPRYLRAWGELDATDGSVTYEDERMAPLASIEVDRLDGADAVVKDSGAVGVKNGYTMSAWESDDSGGFSKGVTIVVTRDSDGAEVFRTLEGADKPRIAHVDSSNGHLVCLYGIVGGSGGLDALVFDTSDESTSTFNVFASGGHRSFDAVHRPGEEVFDFYWVPSAGTSISNRTYNTAGTILTSATPVSETIHSPEVEIQVTVRGGSSTTQILTWVRDNGGSSYDPRWMAITAPGTSTIVTGASNSLAAAATAPLITAVHGAGLHGNYYSFMVSRDASGVVPKHVEFSSRDAANLGVDSLPSLYHTQCSGKPVNVDGTPYWPIVSTQQTHAIGHIVMQSQAIAALSQGVSIAGNFLVGRAAPNQFVGSTALRGRTMIFPAVRQANQAADQSGVGVDIYDQPVNVFAEVSGTPKGTITIGDNAYRSGAVTSLFDGGYRPMIGAFEPPNSATLTASNSSGSLSSGVYRWRLVAEYIDADGRRWQSRPSDPLVLNVISPEDTVDLDDIYLPPGWMGGHYPALPVSVRLYRTEVNGSVYYDTGKNLPYRWGNSPLILSFQDQLSDANLISNPLLYSEGGIENAPPPPSRDIAFANGRIWIVSSDDENVIKVSKSIIDGEGIHFSDELTLDTPGQGKILALREMDGNMIILRRSSIYAVVAQAPNDSGVGSFGSPRLITSEIGCISSQSAVRTDEGIMFQSDRGIYLLDRSLSLKPIGVPVEDYSKGDWIIFKSAVKLRDHEVWFMSRNNALGNNWRWIVWNTLYKRWSYSSVFGTSFGKAADFIFKNDRYIMCSDDSVAESGSHVLSELNTYSGRVKTVTTPWLSFSQARQALQRIKRVLLFGEWRSSTSITIEIYKDWDESTVAQTLTFAATSGYSSGDALRFRGHIAPQKAEALKFKIYDTTSGSGEGARFSTLTLRYQSKRSGLKLPDSLSI